MNISHDKGHFYNLKFLILFLDIKVVSEEIHCLIFIFVLVSQYFPMKDTWKENYLVQVRKLSS